MNARLNSIGCRIILVLCVGAMAYMAGRSNRATTPAEDKASGNPPKNSASIEQREQDHGQALPSIMRIPISGSAKDRALAKANNLKLAIDIGRLLRQNANQGLDELAMFSPGIETNDLYQHAFATWAQDPKLAANAAGAAYLLPSGPERTAALAGVIHQWGSTNPQDLLDWASSIAATDSEPLKNALLDVSEKQAEDQPDLAAQYLDKLTDASARNQVIGAIASTVSENNPAAALNWLDQTATGVAYDINVKKVFSNVGSYNPVQAAALLDQVTEPDVRATVMANLASTWGGSDPQSALAWANSLPDSEAGTRNSVLSSIVATWSKNDPSAATAWVEALPDAEQRAALAQRLNQNQSR
jgi:hypothetical protein